uniref:Uncharacterized protein n=1 Tax=Ciona intestinalis TaxID=7719 RepID=F6XLY7_CIOIN
MYYLVLNVHFLEGVYQTRYKTNISLWELSCTSCGLLPFRGVAKTRQVLFFMSTMLLVGRPILLLACVTAISNKLAVATYAKTSELSFYLSAWWVVTFIKTLC